MKIAFTKYHGAGNDFILIDNRQAKIKLTQKQIAFMCHRHFGIGSDGLMLLEKHKTLDFTMRYYNPDGSEGMMCGNGGRCIVKFAKDLGIIKHKTHFLAPDGEHFAEIKKNIVRLKMADVNTVENIDNEIFINTGAPHYILFSNKLSNENVVEKGKAIRNNKTFKEKGTNVNFVQVKPDGIAVRTYERGVENETLACGTGIVASAMAAYIQNKNLGNSIAVKALGGHLKVDFKVNQNAFTEIWLSGPAKYVFKGKIKLKP